MGDVVNLRQARKARKRADDQRLAAANRAVHGRTKAERQLADSDRQRLDATVEGARRELPETDQP